MSNGGGDGSQPKGSRPQNQEYPRSEPTAALASLLGIALGILASKGLLEHQELATIFSLAEGSAPGAADAISILDIAKACASSVQETWVSGHCSVSTRGHSSCFS
jgi:hypothetical protein